MNFDSTSCYRCSQFIAKHFIYSNIANNDNTFIMANEFLIKSQSNQNAFMQNFEYANYDQYKYVKVELG